MNKQLQTRIGELLKKDYFKLKFGCEFKFTNPYWGNQKIKGYVIKGDKFHTGDSDVIDNMDEFTSGNWKIKEILGTEPTLQDVLLAIDSKKYCIDCKGNFGTTSNVDSGLPTMKYDLTKSLFQQTDEVKQQLLELLK